MKANVNNLEDLLKSGVYSIKNIINNKYYIGSTTMTIQKRIFHHVALLRAKKHKNTYLQNAFNKYGEENFIVEIIEITNKENIIAREQYWIDYYKNKFIIYNINPLATGLDTSKETIEKRRQTMLRKYASGELDHVKEKLRNKIPWNKGKKYQSTDHLKKPKTITTKIIEKRLIHSIQIRELLPKIYVKDFKGNDLGIWRSGIDLSNESKDINFILNQHMKLRNLNGRNGYTPYWLSSYNINKSCKTNKPYKGLYFSYKPS